MEGMKDWERWLTGHHESSPGVWLMIAKKGSALTSVSYAEALEAALCHGWIDGQRKSHDAESFLQKFTPRGARSIWSKVNRDRALALIAGGAMKPAGLRAVERAKANGQWDAAYDGQRSIEIPDDLRAALARNAKANAAFGTLDSQNRYAILFRLATARRPETRAKRLKEFVAMLARGEKLHER